MSTPPESTKNSLRWKLREHARNRWPELADIATRFRGQFAYVEAALPGQSVMPLMRLRYGGSANRWDLRSTSPAAANTRTRSCPTAP